MGSDRTEWEGLDKDRAVSRVTGVLHCPHTHFSSTASRISVGAGEGEGGGGGQRGLAASPSSQGPQWHSSPWSNR